MKFEWINISNVDDAVIREFDCGSHVFNDFLYEKARKWGAEGECITYIFADADEVKNEKVSRIYGFASINTLGLLFDNDGKNGYLPCAEIRMFAIAKELRKRHDQTVEWSDVIFKTLLQNLYFISTSVIGFKAIFLNANHNGLQLYLDNGFEPIEKYVVPEADPKIEIQDCTPLLLAITSEAVYDIFL